MTRNTKRRERAFALTAATDLLRARAALIVAPVPEIDVRLLEKRKSESVFTHAALVYLTSERAASCVTRRKRDERR